MKIGDFCWTHVLFTKNELGKPSLHYTVVFFLFDTNISYHRMLAKI